MKKIVLVYGLIAGAIVGGMLIVTMPLYESGTLNFENGEILGYTTMFIALSLVFFGVKSYRDNHLSGVITFGNGLKVGLLITLVAGIVYCLSWELTYNTMEGDFVKQYSEKQIVKMKESGASAEEVQKAIKKMDEFAVMYRNPIVRFGVTLLEILPVGIFISLVSALLFRNRKFLPSESRQNA